MVGRRIITGEEKVVRALVGVGVHQEGSAWRSVAACAADLLVEPFERAGQSRVDDGANIWLVDAHPKCDRRNHHFELPRQERALNPLARLSIKTSMVCSSGHKLRKL